MTYYLKNGNRYNVSAKASIDIHEKLPAGTYTIKQDPMSGQLYLEQIDNFEIKGKIYGDTLRTADRILNTFQDRSSSTGVMLSGEKGSGKTLLAKKLSLQGQEDGIPTIVINQPWHGEEFNSFLQMIEQPTIVIFDEFEKVYEREDQEKMLTLLDGVYPSKKLFIITCNDKWRVNEHMRNRPGRIYYRLDYTGLSHDFIVEYCEDNLTNKAHIESVAKIATVFSQFNFDMLKAMVEEMNRYNETPQEVMKILNAKPELADAEDYEIRLQVGKKAITDKELGRPVWSGNPMNGEIIIEYYKADAEEWEQSVFSSKDLRQIEASTGKFQFVNADGHSAWLTKIPKSQFNWTSLV